MGMGIVSMILGFFGNIIKGVLIDALKTPAIKTQVDDVGIAIDIPATTDDVLLDQYAGLLDRG